MFCILVNIWLSISGKIIVVYFVRFRLRWSCRYKTSTYSFPLSFFIEKKRKRMFRSICGGNSISLHYSIVRGSDSHYGGHGPPIGHPHHAWCRFRWRVVVWWGDASPQDAVMRGAGVCNVLHHSTWHRHLLYCSKNNV